MKFTISIINYNYGRYLKKSISSALFQENIAVPFEVLVIDDGSTDESDDVLKEFLHHKEFRISKTSNQGFAKSLTRAVLEAKGEFIFLLDADDFFAPNKVSSILPYLEKGMMFISDSSNWVDEKNELLNRKATGSTSTIAMNREAAACLLPVENELSFHTLQRVGLGIMICETYTFYRRHNNSMTNRKEAGKWQKYLAEISNNLSSQLLQKAQAGELDKLKIPAEKVRTVAFEFRSQSYYNALEAALELKEIANSYRNFFFMLRWHLKAGKSLNLFHIKMFVRTLLLYPSQPKG